MIELDHIAKDLRVLRADQQLSVSPTTFAFCLCQALEQLRGSRVQLRKDKARWRRSNPSVEARIKELGAGKDGILKIAQKLSVGTRVLQRVRPRPAKRFEMRHSSVSLVACPKMQNMVSIL